MFKARSYTTKLTMVDRCKKATANLQVHQEADKPGRYDMRCIQCAAGHRLCTRFKPCKICIGAGRFATCAFPVKANRITVEYGKVGGYGEDDDDEDEIAINDGGKEREQDNQDENMEVRARVLL
jgi:hypothetical protein